MSDIVERLRLAPSADFYRPSKWFELMVEAADEIERLRHDWAVACKDLGEARADNEQLRAAIAHVCQRSQRACEILNEFWAHARGQGLTSSK